MNNAVSNQPSRPTAANGTPTQTAQQRNVERAQQLLGTFASGDADLATNLLAEDYIQHNLAFANGRDAFVASVLGLTASDVPATTVQNVRAFADGDYVFLQTIYNFAGAGEQVAFDIFRFDADGKIAEPPARERLPLRRDAGQPPREDGRLL